MLTILSLGVESVATIHASMIFNGLTPGSKLFQKKRRKSYSLKTDQLNGRGFQIP